MLLPTVLSLIFVFIPCYMAQSRQHRCYSFTSMAAFNPVNFAGEWKTTYQARQGYDYEWLRCINDTYTLEKNGKFDILYTGFDDNGGKTVVHYKATPVQRGSSKYSIIDLDSDVPKTLTVIDTDYTSYAVAICCDILGDDSLINIGVYGRVRYVSDEILHRAEAKFAAENITLPLIKIEDRC